MNEVRNLVIGIEINTKTSQIAYFDRKANEPVSVPSKIGTNLCECPTVLAKKSGQDRWFAGYEAEYFSASEGIIRLPNPLTAAVEGKTVEADGERVEGTVLLATFIRELLKGLGVPNVVKNTEAVCVTTEELSGELAGTLLKALELCGFRRELCYVQDEGESFCYFGYCQKPEVSARNMALICFDEDDVRFLAMTELRNSKPFAVVISREEETTLPAEPVKRDEAFEAAVLEWMDGTSYSGVFITGEGFGADWARKSVRALSRGGARVFAGDNLFAKGACWAALEKKEPKHFRSRLYFGPNLVRASVGIDVIEDGIPKWYPLIKSGVNWYEDRSECQLILDGRADILVTIVSMDGAEHRNAKLKLEGLPQRPNRTTRILLRAECIASERFRITAEDLGFGELFPSSGKHWELETEL